MYANFKVDEGDGGSDNDSSSSSIDLMSTIRTAIKNNDAEAKKEKVNQVVQKEKEDKFHCVNADDLDELVEQFAHDSEKNV
jgi:hypothetical protein